MKKILIYVYLLLIAFTYSCKEEDHGIMPPINIEKEEGVSVDNGIVTVNPVTLDYAFQNPMKGWREYHGPGYDKKRDTYPYPYGSMSKEYMQWNMMEEIASDGVNKIVAYSDHRWDGVEDMNLKVIPRIFIVWMEPWHGGYAKNTYVDDPDDLNGWHWPSDMPGQSGYDDKDLNKPITGGYFDENFQDRIAKFIEKAGQAWDNDPRVAYVEMGIIGEWGEHHDPNITTYWAPHDQPTHVENRTWIPGIEKTLGDAFAKAFKNKKVMVRYAYEFKNYDFGVYWDSWSIDEEIVRGYEEMIKRGDYWKTQPVGGEITWNWGSLSKYKNLEGVVANSDTRKLVIDQIRSLHCNHLGGVTWANFDDPTFKANAELIQKVMGYRYKLSKFKYPTKINKGESFKVSFNVVNEGSSPFYYNWPVEIALLDAETKAKVWNKNLDNVDITQWLPGDNWSSEEQAYLSVALTNEVEATLTLDVELEAKDYIISISILDPAGNLPSLRFAAKNYFEGGRHPMGYIGVNKDEPEIFEIGEDKFYDLRQDRTLHYKVDK